MALRQPISPNLVSPPVADNQGDSRLQPPLSGQRSTPAGPADNQGSRSELPAEPEDFKGQAYLCVDGGNLQHGFLNVKQRFMGSDDFSYMVACIQRKWKYKVIPYYTDYLSTEPRCLRDPEACRALERFHDGINEKAYITKFELKSDGRQRGADIVIADKLREKVANDSVGILILVSGDGDFEPTLSAIRDRQSPKPVYLVAWRHSFNIILSSRVIETLFLEDVFPAPSAAPPADGPRPSPPRPPNGGRGPEGGGPKGPSRGGARDQPARRGGGSSGDSDK